MHGRKFKPTDYRTQAEPKARAGDIPVFCSHDAIIPINELIPNPKNPNTHPAEQIRLLSQCITSNGWRMPITISNRSGFIVKGHGRLEAAQAAGFTHVPVDYQNYASEAEEMTDLMADNRLAELSSMDNDLLAAALNELIESEDIDSILTGYDEEDIAALLGTEEEEEAPEEEEWLPPVEPLCKAGDVWNLGEHRFMVADSDKAELKAADRALSAYILQTGNLICSCVRGGETHEYMDLIREWADDNQMPEILDKKIPVVKERD